MIKLEFVRFNTEPRYDNVTIYEGASGSGVVVTNFSGSSLPDDIVSANSLSVLFRSDGSATRTGFEVKYTILRSDSGKSYQVTQSVDKQGILLIDSDID